MGNTGARLFGMGEAPVPTKDSVAGVVAQVCVLLFMAVASRFTDIAADRCCHQGEGLEHVRRLEWGGLPVVIGSSTGIHSHRLKSFTDAVGIFRFCLKGTIESGWFLVDSDLLTDANRLLSKHLGMHRSFVAG